MNQILISEKIYVTPAMKKKRKLFKVEFVLSVFLVVVLSSYGIYAEYDKNKSEEVSKEILGGVEFTGNKITRTRVKTSPIVVIINKEVKEVKEAEPVLEVEEDVVVPDEKIFIASDGKEYYTVGNINIPKIKVNYPILSSQSEQLLKVSVCKLYGPKPNEVRQFMYNRTQLLEYKIFQ